MRKKEKRQLEQLMARAMRLKQREYKEQQALRNEALLNAAQDVAYQQFKAMGYQGLKPVRYDSQGGKIITNLSRSTPIH